MKILVTGGAGYIGSFTVDQLQKANHEVVVFDNLVYGHKNAINCPLVIGDLADYEQIERVCREGKFDAVVHFAAFIAAGESMENPSKYYNNNIIGGLHLFDSMVKNNIKKLVFSSTAAVYGNPVHIPILEDDPKIPTNVYGRTKLMIEQILEDFDQAYGLKSIRIRYFNASGGAPDGTNGENHDPETHIIPLALAATSKGQTFKIFGGNYPTFDGTCIRDYIHVLDLASAHILALQTLAKNNTSNYFNAGTGAGYSNKQIIEMVEKVTGKKLQTEIIARRPGDPNELVAGCDKIKKELGWQAKYSDLETIIKTAWLWYQNHPDGFQKD